MHRDLLLKGLTAMIPKTTFRNFQNDSGISSISVAKSLFNFLSSNNIGRISKNAIEFSGSDRIHAAILALEMGCDIEDVSLRLSWKDFEQLTSQLLLSFGYKTKTNVHLTNPRMEIDVVAISSGIAIVIDCKHWRRCNYSLMSSFTRKQSARAKRLLELESGIDQAVPVMITLHAESVNLVEGVPVVPIHKFSSFVLNVNYCASKGYGL